MNPRPLLFPLALLVLFAIVAGGCNGRWEGGWWPGGGMGRPGHMGRGMMGGPGPTAPPPLSGTPAPATPESVARGGEVYRVNCAACHGDNGRGDGPAAVSLNPRPRDLTALPPTSTVNAVAGVISYGFGAMPPFEQVLSREQIWDAANYVATLRGGTRD